MKTLRSLTKVCYSRLLCDIADVVLSGQEHCLAMDLNVVMQLSYLNYQRYLLVVVSAELQLDVHCPYTHTQLF